MDICGNVCTYAVNWRPVYTNDTTYFTVYFIIYTRYSVVFKSGDLV